PVRIQVTSKDGKQTFADQSGVDVGEDFTASASTKEFAKDTRAQIFNASGQRIEDVTFHTACSQPINLGNRFGSLEVVGINSTEGGNVQDGAEVLYIYKITNSGTTPVANVAVEDDKLGTVTGSPIASLAPGATTTLTAR